MEDKSLSRVVRISDSRAAAIFANSRMRRLLMQFAVKPRAISSVAEQMNMDLRQVHYFTRRLVDLGLLRVAQVVSRPGRPIKLYRTVGHAFMVPAELMQSTSTEGLANELRDLLAHGGEGGLLLTIGAAGEPQVQVIGRQNRRNPDFELWRILQLSASEVQSMKAELEAVLQKYQLRSGGKRAKIFLVHCAGAARLGNEGPVDNPSI